MRNRVDVFEGEGGGRKTGRERRKSILNLGGFVTEYQFQSMNHSDPLVFLLQMLSKGNPAKL